jgi:general secretion pathway protein N
MTCGWVSYFLIVGIVMMPAVHASPAPIPIATTPTGNSSTSSSSGTDASAPGGNGPAASGLSARSNPLWEIPLNSLTATSERPIFLPSRRVAPPVPPAAPPPPSPQPVAAPARERPQLALVGAVVGEPDRIAVFLDEITRSVIRLRIGEGYEGWVLRGVKGREATLEREHTTVTLALPSASGEEK